MSSVKKTAISFLVVFTLLVGVVGVINVDTSYAAAKKYHLRKTTISVTAGKTFQQKLIAKNGKTIKATKVKWKSAKPKIAKIDKRGKIKAVKAGTVKMTAKYKGKTYKFTVKVKKKPTPKPKHNTYISLNQNTLTLTEGETSEVVVHTNKGEPIQYSCPFANISCTWGDWINNTDCILKVNAKKAGTVYVTVFDQKDKNIETELTVIVKPNVPRNILSLCDYLVARNVELDGKYYDIKKETVGKYQTHYDKIYVTKDIKTFGFQNSYFSGAPTTSCCVTTTDLEYGIRNEGLDKTIVITCEIVDEPYGDGASLPAYKYVLKASIDRTKYKQGDKLNWELVQNDSSKPRDVDDLASSFADFAVTQCIYRYGTFIKDKYNLSLPEVGIN